MELFWQFVGSLVRCMVAALVVRVLAIYLSLQISYLSTFLLGVLAYALYHLTIWPYLDPLRVFPLVDINDIRIVLPVTDVPRGESALEWARKYQNHDIVRVRVLRSTTALVLLSIDALRDAFGTNQYDFAKPEGGRHFLANILGYGLILSEGAIHARQRKQLTTAFRVQNIRALQSLMVAKAEILVKNMEVDNESGSVEITKWASKVTLDIIGEALMSKEFDSLNVNKQPVNEAFSRLTEANPGITLLFMMSMVFPQWMVRLLPTRTNKNLHADIAIVRKSCEGPQIEASDILATIRADPEASEREIVDQMVTFLGAGHETTATSIAWVVHLLTLPEGKKYQEKLRAELQETDDGPWLGAICEETLRLFPPVTSTARIAVKDTTLAGVSVAKGTMVLVFPWAVNRDERHWEDAEMFKPERWLTDGRLNGNGGAGSNYSNMTFLHGVRSCIGKGFAKAELRIVVGRLFKEFEVERLPGDDGKVTPVGSLTIKPEGGLRVRLTRV